MEDTCIRIPTLRSPRLTLRALRADDHKHLLAMAHDPEVTRYLNEGPPHSAAEVWRRMAPALGQWALRGYGMFAVEDRDGFIGRIGVYHPYEEPQPQLSYVLCRRSWGKGYATEGVGLVRDWMLANHRPNRLVSHISPENTLSARVASKLGAVRDGATIRSEVILDIWSYSPTRTPPPRLG
jgi:RimJ/RimL family protein N-acetyltransferase